MGKQTKFIFVTGGVVSSIGKGLASASMGALMEARGLRVTHIKLDPYLNVDPGTMSPYQHGEVFVTDDGTETDLDLGHYERFSSAQMTRRHNLTSGRIYRAVIEKERSGGYLGETVQVIPHVTDEIKDCVRAAADDVDIAIIEVGGTVGDIESLPFLEALRQMKLDLGPQNAVSVHVTLVPFIATAGEMKTKPTQHSVKEMREIGIQPDVLICRAHEQLSRSIKEKIALFSNVPVEGVIAAVDVSCIYALPLALHQERLDTFITDRLNIWSRRPDLSAWEEIVRRATAPTRGTVRIGLIGKYVHLHDAYKSLREALVHGGMANEVSVDLDYIDAEKITPGQGIETLSHLDAILVAPGFGERGTEGKIEAVRYARTQGIPFFGICLGMQMAVTEFARNVCGLKDANSTEFDVDTPHPVVDLMSDQRSTSQKGGTMRLGAYPCILKAGSHAAEAYGTTKISERHRHRYEFSNNYRDQLEKAGLILSGTSPDGHLVEVIELANHPYFLACQFHPEFKSRPMAPHPLFTSFVRAAMAHRDARIIPKPAPSEAVPALAGLGQPLPVSLPPLQYKGCSSLPLSSPFRTSSLAFPIALATLLPPLLARAGGLAGDGPQRRVEQETFLLTWDHQSRVEHLLVAAQATGLKGSGAYLLGLPMDTMLDRPLDGIHNTITNLLPEAAPLSPAAGGEPALAPHPAGISELCKTWKLTCHSELLAWSAKRLPRQELALVPLTEPSPEGRSNSVYAHFRFDAEHPFLPFAEPEEDLVEPDPPLPSPEHPPRIQLFLELYNESPAGRWERQMDNTLEQQRSTLISCYSKALEQRRKLSGSIQVQMMMDASNFTEEEEARADSKLLDPVARCFATVLSKAIWPKNPFRKRIHFVAHATLRPPTATPRRMLAIVLSTQDVEPRLGHAEEPRVVPELKQLASLEPEPETLRRAFPEATRQALGLDLSRRWRLIAFETSVDPHGIHDDIELRPLPMPTQRPGEAPLPVIARGDLPSLPTPTQRTPPWWKRRHVKWIASFALISGTIAFILWRELKKPREEDAS